MPRILACSCSLFFLVAACNTREPTSDQQARVRNQPPAACAQADFAACPALEVAPCADGQEPVIDYASDCCPHFSCQPLCVAARPCPPSPAPVCPPGTRLWIGTALEDCCPAYRCEPDTVCQGAAEDCPLAMPYCGPGVEPQVVGYSRDCCPILQCPCERTPDGQWNDAYCGCTYPGCLPGEQLECWGANVCGYPCECRPAGGNCQFDADCQYDCGPGTDCEGISMRCDLSRCLPSPGCDPADPNTGCTADCWGVCVGNTQDGCKWDGECPAGQRCEMMCAGYGCVPTGDYPCECETDPNCVANPDGSCSCWDQCQGQCMPIEPPCPEPFDPTFCPVPRCPNPVAVGSDQCGCPIYECPPICTPLPDGQCPPNMCYCGVQTGVDANCCPIIFCPDVTPPTPCPDAGTLPL